MLHAAKIDLSRPVSRGINSKGRTWSPGPRISEFAGSGVDSETLKRVQTVLDGLRHSSHLHAFSVGRIVSK